MSPAHEFIVRLQKLKAGDLGRLRQLAGRDLDTSLDAFDLFSGLWWPLRQKNQRAPRRGVAWLIIRLYAACPIPHENGRTLAREIALAARSDPAAEERFNRLLTMPLGRVEPALRGLLPYVTHSSNKLDWDRLTDDLSIWERQQTRLKWAEEFLLQSQQTSHQKGEAMK